MDRLMRQLPKDEMILRRMSAFGGGFNGSTQHIRRTSQLASFSPESSSDVHSIFARWHPGWPASSQRCLVPLAGTA
jgi:hypothetical protein